MCKKIHPAQPAEPKPVTPDQQAMIDYAVLFANAEVTCLLEDLFEGAVRGVPLDRWPAHITAVIRGALRDHPNPHQFLHDLQRELLDLIAPHIPPLSPDDLDD